MPFLESLSTGELAELADRNGIDVPPGIERVFIIGELLELERADALRQARRAGHVPEPVNSARGGRTGEFGEVETLPDGYGMSYVDVLIRDPLWVFVFWDVKKRPRDFQDAPPADDETPVEYCLRVVPLRGENPEPDTAASFLVAVGEGDRSLYLGIPRDDGRRFRIDLCVARDGGRAVLAESRPFRLPRLVDERAGTGGPAAGSGGDADALCPETVCRNPLSRLSGADRFTLVRSVDRLPRAKGA